MHKIAIINGPNLNLLGSREPEIYGAVSFETYFAHLQAHFPSVEFFYFQSNVEGEIINHLQACNQNVDGILLNTAAYTHTSIAIADTVKAIDTPVIEIHISNVLAREEYRKTSYIASACIGSISGLGLEGYALGVSYLLTKTKTS
jgi:3-dehydroquinate dehydratase-2